MFMCSELYVAAFEGRIQAVTGLLSGNRSTAVAEANGQPSQPGRSNAIHQGLCCITREVTAEQSTLLHIAAGQGHCELIAELCLRDSALLSLPNSSLDTPLHCAARAGHADAIEAIVMLTTDNVEEDMLRVVLNSKNKAGDTALHVSARHGHGAAVETVMKLAPELASELNGADVSPLYLAVMSRSVRAVAAIIGCSDAAAAGPNSQNALHAAVLQSSGKDTEGLSALHAAASMGNLPAVRLLLQFYPASADILDNHGRSFIHAAAMRGHRSIIAHAIKNRMLERLLNEQDVEGNTALHLAVQAGEYKVVSKLLCSGKVQTHILNNAGHTPFDLVENSTGFFSMVSLFDLFGGFHPQPYVCLICKLQASLVVKLFVYGAQFRPQRQDHINIWNGQDVMKWREATSKNLAIVSTLVATVAFSAAFNVPGSYGSDGKANLNGNRMYNAFLLLDTIAVTTAVLATILLIYGRASRSRRSWITFIISLYLLWLSLLSMMLGFYTAIAAVMSDNKPMKTGVSRLIYCGLYILMTLLTELAMPGSLLGVLQFVVGGCSGRQRHVKRHTSRQYPFVAIYAINMFLFVVVNTIAISAVDTTANLR
ncbi:hypothetical protein BAE44_0008957 [Dichanthelium oligosanthes]|uniref:PGG domain-containing protein n=1 Tax=Dichanthelium oligosanthes TaxID=888268 RepID=A0A1E5VY29_9POAL|nr:hypothetical protein BAE44_0008957 [Dichanthelium oligosanthes]